MNRTYVLVRLTADVALPFQLADQARHNAYIDGRKADQVEAQRLYEQEVARHKEREAIRRARGYSYSGIPPLSPFVTREWNDDDYEHMGGYELGCASVCGLASLFCGPVGIGLWFVVARFAPWLASLDHEAVGTRLAGAEPRDMKRLRLQREIAQLVVP